MKSKYTPMLLTSTTIREACQLADDAITSEYYNFETLDYLAQIGLEHLRESFPFDNCTFTTRDGISLSVTRDDALELLNLKTAAIIPDGATLEFTQL